MTPFKTSMNLERMLTKLFYNDNGCLLLTPFFSMKYKYSIYFYAIYATFKSCYTDGKKAFVYKAVVTWWTGGDMQTKQSQWIELSI